MEVQCGASSGVGRLRKWRASSGVSIAEDEEGENASFARVFFFAIPGGKSEAMSPETVQQPGVTDPKDEQRSAEAGWCVRGGPLSGGQQLCREGEGSG